MIDPFGRHITYLRISVTDRCDFRCLYCMPAQMTFMPRKELLSLEELTRLCRIFASLGVRKIRVTGGEPLVRRDVITLFEGLGELQKENLLDEVTLTTNGSQLETHAEALYANGVRRVNVSLDTYDAEKFTKITRNGKLERVMRGIETARAVGLKIKINCVAMKGFNEDEIHAMVERAGAMGDDLTFIEIMPMGAMEEGERLGQYWPLSELRHELEKKWTLVDNAHRTGGPARYVTCLETKGRIGFITPLTHNFCESCNRVRVTCQGRLYLCLGQEDHADLRATLREFPNDDDTVKTAILQALIRKPKGHDFIIDRKNIQETPRYMSITGG